MRSSNVFQALLVAGAVALCSTEASAQTPYVVSHSMGTYTPITGGQTYAPVQYPIAVWPAWDEGYATIPLPFDFTFFSATYDTVYAYTNGFVAFQPPGPNGPSVLGPPSTVPSQTNPIHSFIGAAWDDLDGSAATSEIRAETLGTAPNRRFVVQLSGLDALGDPSSNLDVQFVFHEGSSQFDVIYGPTNGLAGATTAIENETGTEGFNLLAPGPTCGAGCTCTPGTCNSTNWQPSGFTITTALPDDPELTATVSAPPGAYPGTNFDVDVDLRNLGLDDAGSYDYDLYLTSSNTSTAGGQFLGSFTQPSHTAATVINAMHTVGMPMNQPVGTVFVAVVVDVNDTVTEVIETNNVAFSDPIATAPDLTGTVVVPGTTGPGEVMDVDFTLENRGAPVTSPVSVTFFLSPDQALDGFDESIHTELITLPDGFLFDGVVQITVPLTVQPSPPNYYVIADIDDQDQVPEPNENNNEIASSTSVLVDGPELEVTSFTADQIGFRGLVYPVRFTIENSGGATARDFTACVVLSDNLLISLVTDTLLPLDGGGSTTTQLVTLVPGEAREYVLQAMIPAATSTGTYYVAAVADCGTVVNEAVETNNIKRLDDPVLVRDIAPDFVPLDVATTSAAASGEQLPVAVRFANLGNDVGDTHLRLVISDNPGATLMDRTIYDSTTPTSLTPPGETTTSVWATLPGDLASGSYYIGAIVDPDDLVDEVYEDNNIATFGPITVVGADLAVVSPAPPPAIIGVAYARRFSAVGGSADYAWEIEWQDGAAPDGLSFDGELGELSGTPEATAEGRHAFTVRVTSGNLVAERDYTLIVTPPTIGLEVVSSRLPPALAQEPYSVQLVAVGGTPPYEWQLGGGNPPPGVSVSPDGDFGGEPQIVGGYTFEVFVRDATGARATGILALDVIDPSASVTITTADVPDGEVGSEYSTSFAAAGGSTPYTWRLEGDIPGLSFDGDTAALTGTPTVAGDYPIVVEVRDRDGLLDRNAYVLRILEEGALQITNGQSTETGLPPAQVGVEYLDSMGEPVRLRAVKPGGDLAGVVWTVLVGDLPPGISLDATTGEISGVPEQDGSFPFIVQVRDDARDVARTSLVIFVEPPDGMMGGDDDDEGGCGCTAAEDRASLSSMLLLGGLAMIALWRRRRRRRRAGRTSAFFLAAALTVLTPELASAQPVPYQVFEETAPYQQLGAGATQLNLGDGTTTPIPLPFDFYFYGDAYSTIYVNANGLLFVQSAGSGHHFPAGSNPSPTSPNGYIAGLWSDWCSDSTGCFGVTNPGIGVFYEIDSTPGSQKITIEYRAIRHFSDNAMPSNSNFQIVLYEGLSSKIEFHYGPQSIGTDFFGGPTQIQGRIGIENTTGSDGMWLGPCQASPCGNPDVLALPDSKITVIADAGEDMTAAGVQVPPVGYPGLPFPASARIISRHQNPLGPFQYAVYLLPGTATSTAGATLVYESAPITLAGYESRLVSFDVEVPNDQAVGQYRVGVLVDHLGDVDETSETNNFTFSAATVRIADRAPDFRLVSIQPLQSELRPGDTLDVAYTVENFGNEPGRLELEAYLSANEAITISDVPFGSLISFDTAPREVVTGTISAQVPAGIATGTYYVGLILDPSLQVPELDEANNVGRSGGRVTVSSTDVEIITDALPTATLGQGYSTRVRAAGGAGEFTFALVSGELPQGMIFDADSAELTGIPLEVGTFSLEIEATSGAASGSKTFDFQVLDPTYPLTIASRSLPDGTLGSDYAVGLVAVGGDAPYVWRMVEGTLPRGLFFAPDGTLFGAPSEGGFTNFAVEVRDNMSATASVSLTLDIRSPGNLTIISSALPDGRLDEPYSQQLVSVGGVEPITWRSVTVLPDGLTITGDGVLTGIPEIAGDYRFRVEVTDARGNADTNELTLRIVATGRFAIVTTELPMGEPNMEYRAIIQAEGGREPYTWELIRGEGFLPPGFVVEQSDGIAEGETENDLVVRGTLEREGVWAFTARVWDAKGRFDEQPFAIVSRVPIVMPPPGDGDEGGCGCAAAHETGTGLFGLLLLPLALVLRRGRRFLQALALCFVLLATSTASAQLYVATQYGSAYQQLTGGTAVTFPFGDTDDGSVNVPLPFNFTYYGQSYDTITVSVNGAAVVANSCTNDTDCDSGFGTCVANRCEYYVPYLPTALPDPSPPNRVLGPFWADLIFGAGSSVSTQTLGAAPNREFVIQWTSIGRYDFVATTSRANFQLRLDEASGAIRFHYGSFESAADDFLWTGGVVGIEDDGGTEGLSPLACSGTCGAADLMALQNQVIELALPVGPELVGTAVAPTGGDPGVALDVEVTVQNIGTQPSGPFDVEVYFSTDTTIDASDTLIDTLSFASVAAMSNAMMTASSTVPAVPPGFYTVGAIIDSGNAVTEVIEANNTVLATTSFLVGSDLAVTVETPPPTGPTETFTAGVQVVNNGSAQPAVGVAVYLSEDPILDAGDYLVGTATVAVPAQPTTDVGVPCVVPGNIIPGDYYAIAEVDFTNAIPEADETNNRGVSPALAEVTGADVVAVVVDAEGNFAFRGGMLQVLATIRNTGGAATGDFFYAFHLSENELINSLSDPLLGELGPINLGPGESLEVAHSVPVPASLMAGPYFLGLIADSQSAVTEEFESNNISRTQRTLEVRDPAEDFTAAEIRVPATGAAGESLVVARTIVNVGNAPGMVEYDVYLSADADIDPAVDTPLGTGSLQLTAFEENIGVDNVRLPPTTPAGLYFIGYVIDPNDMVAELDETNNVVVSDANFDVLANELLIITDRLPVAVLGTEYEVLFTAAGGAGSYAWSLAEGALPAGLSLDAGGFLSGVAAEEGLFDVTVAVSDGALTATRDFTLVASSQSLPLEIVTRSLVPSFVDREYRYPLTAFGGVAPYRWSVQGTLPAGLSLAEDGLISGVPTLAATDTLTFRVEDSAGAFAERPITIRVVNNDDTVRMSDDVLPDGRIGEQYDTTLRVAQGTGSSPFDFGLAGGKLPPGLILELDRIHGIPEAVGIFTFAVRVTDNRGDFDVNRYVVQIEEAEGVGFVTTDLPSGVVGEAYADELGEPVSLKAVSSGTTGSITFRVIGGQLPPGMSLAMDGAVSGTPSSSGIYPFTVMAQDDKGQQSVRAYGIRIIDPPQAPPPATKDEGGCGCAAAQSEPRSAAWVLLLLGALFLFRRRRLGLLVVAVGSLIPSAAKAQQYFTETASEPYLERTGGTPVAFGSVDEDEVTVTLPFDFRFYSTDYSQVTIGTNGYVTFTPQGSEYDNDPIPTSAPPNAMIAPWWDDLDEVVVSVHEEGTAPSRSVVIQWDAAERWLDAAAGVLKFQVILHEGPSGLFELRWGPSSGISNPGSWDATVGYENAGGTTGEDVLGCGAGCSGTDFDAALDMVFRAQQDGGPDAVARDITVPAVVYPGIPFEAVVRIQSLHMNPLGPMVYRVHLLAQGETELDNPVFTSQPFTLSPYQAFEEIAMPAVPLDQMNGRYALALEVDADDDLAEPNETNNVILSATDFRLAARQPDFKVAGVTPALQNASPGSSVDVEVAIENGGNLDGAADWRLVLSRNAVISTDDLVVHTASATLPLLTTSSVTVPVSLPADLSPGDYYFGVVMDPTNAVGELDEVNNAGASAAPITVVANAVNVVTSNLPGGYVDVPYSAFLTAAGGDGTYDWSLVNGTLPAGLNLLPTGEIAGVPTQRTGANFTVEVTSGGVSGQASLTIDIDVLDGGLTIVTREVLPGVVGSAYPPAEPGTPVEQQQHIVALGGDGDVMFNLKSVPPPGLELETDGYLHGVPLQEGEYDLEIEATDGTTTVERLIRITVAEPGRLTLVAAVLPDAQLEDEYAYQLRVIGKAPTSTVAFSTGGPLPPGLTLTQAGRLVGIPQKVGSWIFNVLAVEGQGVSQDTANFRLTVVADAGFGVTPSTLPIGQVQEPYKAVIEAREGRPPFTWRVLGPSLPRGLSYEITDDEREKLMFRGVPEVEAFVTILVTVTDGDGRFAEQPMSLLIETPEAPPPPPVEEGCGCSSAPMGRSTDAWPLIVVGLLGFVRRRRGHPR